jgi:HEAT repeat protein
MGEKAVPGLIDALKQKKNETKKNSIIHILRSMGPEAKTAIPELIPFVSDANVMTRVYATTALARIGIGEASIVPELVKALQDENKTVRSAAAEGLRDIGKLAKEALPALKEKLNDPEESVKEAAQEAIEKIQN